MTSCRLRASLEDTDSAYGIHVDDHTSHIKSIPFLPSNASEMHAESWPKRISARGHRDSLNSLTVQQFAVSFAARIEPYSPPLVELLKVFDDAVRGTVIYLIQSAGVCARICANIACPLDDSRGCEVEGRCRPRWSNPPLLFSSSPRLREGAWFKFYNDGRLLGTFCW